MQVLQTLLDGVRTTCAGFPDKRRGGDVTYSMADIGLSAFSLFFMQSESCLAYQRGLEEGHKMPNCQSLFDMKAIPTDNHIRAMLDPVHPSHLQAAFDQALGALRRHDGLAPFRRLGGRVLIALDGTEYFCSHRHGGRRAGRALPPAARPARSSSWPGDRDGVQTGQRRQGLTLGDGCQPVAVVGGAGKPPGAETIMPALGTRC